MANSNHRSESVQVILSEDKTSIGNTADMVVAQSNEVQASYVSTDVDANYDSFLQNETIEIGDTQEEILSYIKDNLTTDGKVFPNSSSEQISIDYLHELEELYGEKVYRQILRVGVNEIYAKHRYKFKKNIWASYFSSYNWYEPDENAFVSYESFNPTELQNAILLGKEEDRFSSR